MQFTITVPGVNSDSRITDAVILFGTTGDSLPTTVPDGGATVALLGFAVLGLGSARRFLKA